MADEMVATTVARRAALKAVRMVWRWVGSSERWSVPVKESWWVDRSEAQMEAQRAVMKADSMAARWGWNWDARMGNRWVVSKVRWWDTWTAD